MHGHPLHMVVVGRWVGVVLMAAAFARTCGAVTWRECRPAGAGFAVSMPGDVVHAVIDANTPFGSMKLQTWEAAIGDMAFTALYGDYSPATVKKNKADNILMHASDSIVAVTEGTLTINRWLKVGGYPAREVEVVSAKTKSTIRCRMILAGTRLYQVMIARPRATEGGAEVRRFIDSFRLLKPAQAAAKPATGAARKSR